MKILIRAIFKMDPQDARVDLLMVEIALLLAKSVSSRFIGYLEMKAMAARSDFVS